ncbi:MAG: phosphoribosylanthranilate isomerase [Spirochaetaceae bacterium]|jgi:phosphoribosylanthranilate isomerase|nr:phosphoribosylanthranilate isomerase [Spirochaetaceae bacterium]
MAKIKICGLFREEDIGFANEAGPDFVGFVFAPSRRQVSPSRAARLRERLREGIVPVGVFVNAPPALAAALYRDGIIAAVQLHGGEDGAAIAALREICAAPVIKAVAVRGPRDLARWEGVRGAAAPDYLLLDNGGGGTGRRFDWSLMDGGVPLPFFLAGGIDCEGVSGALSYRPYGIDVSGGAETGGIKDREKMIRLVRLVRSPEEGGSGGPPVPRRGEGAAPPLEI